MPTKRHKTKRKTNSSLAWHSAALDVLGPLRWHLQELIDAMEQYNRAAKQIGDPTYFENKVAAAREANEKADKFFSMRSTK